MFLCLVVSAHLHSFSAGVEAQYKIGFLGLFVFFVMSGFLITKLLLDERELTGTICLRSFYRRRFFRIFPALLGYLGGLALLSTLGLASCSVRALLWSVTFLANYRPTSFPSLGHLWSLCVEEQFYLIWPIVFSRLSLKNASRLLVGVICVLPIARVIMVDRGATWITLNHHSEAVADSIAIGCLLAIKQQHLHSSRGYQWFSKSYFCLLVPIIALITTWEGSPLFYQGLGKTVLFVSIAIGLDISVQRADSMWGRLLNSSILVSLGRWSYSLYLWQQVFTLQRPGAQPYAWFPMNLALTLSVGIASYYLIEVPGLRRGRSRDARRTRSSLLPDNSKTETVT
jgi:peptidoglycan/LPS O-acetylase OafA/YrhL